MDTSSNKRPLVTGLLFTPPGEYALTYADWDKKDKEDKEEKEEQELIRLFLDNENSLCCCHWMDTFEHTIKEHCIVECIMAD